jgi:hypothetical protein
MTRVIPLLLVATLFAALPAARGQDKPASAPSGGKPAALQDFHNLERTIEKQFKKCDVCKGKGKVSDAVCSECGGDRIVFAATQDAAYQTHIDGYIAYCELIDKYAGLLDTDQSMKDRVLANRAVYLHPIESQIGAHAPLERVKVDHATAQYRGGEAAGGVYTKLACDLVVAARRKSLGHGIAFDGTVTRVSEGKERPLAEVRLNGPAGEVRSCLVLAPPDAKWAEKTKIRVIGKIIDGAAERKACGLKDDTAVVSPRHGTQ